MRAPSSLIVNAHPSSGYAPRTVHNAMKADLTAAFAFNFLTSGERLTKSSASTKDYIAINLDGFNAVDRAVLLISKLQYHVGPIVNIAGNSLATLKLSDWDQGRINQAVYEVLKITHGTFPIDCIVCGGQTGADIAGAVAGVRLGIPVRVMMPAGFRQRGADGLDYNNLASDVHQSILNQAALLV